ncbi:MAG TPA: hypothetical protein VFD84_15705 [Candidatus Binatia bacterium]|jgi:hypothetical protein|nr:hypothetical protein [Candidatus Binatia bacterium]
MCARSFLALAVLLVGAPAAAFEADLVPVSRRLGEHDLRGSLTIAGAEGTVHVAVTDLNDAQGVGVDERVTLELRLRDGGRRRRVVIPVDVSGGEGEATESLGLQEGDMLVVHGARLRGPHGRTLAEIGSVTAATSPAPPEPPPGECADALASCQSDLGDCEQALDDCESGP